MRVRFLQLGCDKSEGCPQVAWVNQWRKRTVMTDDWN